MAEDRSIRPLPRKWTTVAALALGFWSNAITSALLWFVWAWHHS